MMLYELEFTNADKDGYFTRVVDGPAANYRNPNTKLYRDGVHKVIYDYVQEIAWSSGGGTWHVAISVYDPPKLHRDGRRTGYATFRLTEYDIVVTYHS
jgi:hypothetical protein